jgi:hypothetical protein
MLQIASVKISGVWRPPVDTGDSLRFSAQEAKFFVVRSQESCGLNWRAFGASRSDAKLPLPVLSERVQT